MKSDISKVGFTNAYNEFYNNADIHRWAELTEYKRIIDSYTVDGDGAVVNTAEGDRALHKINILSDKKRRDILSTVTDITALGKCYYVSESGNDNNDGLSAESSWKTLSKVSEFEFAEGDAVFFKRGDVFRGNLKLCDGVSYSAYGTGEKPKLYGSPENGADPEKWHLAAGTDNIWIYEKEMPDVGLVVFNDGEEWSKKAVPSFIDGRYTVRGAADNKAFDFKTELSDLEIFSCCNKELKDGFPARLTKGKLYLRCDRGNPGTIYNSIEFNICGNILEGGGCKNVTVDNLCIKYGGSHGIGAGHVKNLTVKNCEIGWIGGGVQFYSKTNGTAIRYGNGIEVYGSCDGYYVINNYVYQCYDAAITHQQGAGGTSYEFKDIVYANNLVEDCIYSIEYFMSAPQDSQYTRVMKNLRIENNIFRRAGYGFGSQRPNENFATHIMGWWTSLNKAESFIIINNIFDRSTQTLIQINAEEKDSLPKLEDNTYLQNTDGFFGRFGFNNKNTNYFSKQNFYRLKTKDYIQSIDKTEKIYFIK